jgi:hypothetical protein
MTELYGAQWYELVAAAVFAFCIACAGVALLTGRRVLWISFRRWSMAAGRFLYWRRVYFGEWRWTPFAWVVWRGDRDRYDGPPLRVGRVTITNALDNGREGETTEGEGG